MSFDPRENNQPFILVPGASGTNPVYPLARALTLGNSLSFVDGGPGQSLLLSLASSFGSANWFGDGTSGAVTLAANTSATVPTADSSVAVLNYQSLTVNSGVTLTASTRAQALLIYVQGNLINNGTILMDARGASQVCNSNMNITRISVSDTTYFSTESNQSAPVQFTSAQVGGAGGAIQNTGNETNGNNGSTAVNATGGGGSGSGGVGGSSATGSGGAGTAGTAFSGGSGGGSGSYSASIGTNGTAGSANGGAGGAAATGATGAQGSGGGAGNPGGAGNVSGLAGTSGTGGTLIIIVGGNISGSGTISSNGSAGGAATASTTAMGGGGSGAGRVIILYAGNNTGFTGSVQANGGAGGVGTGATASRTGGAGGVGSVTASLVAAPGAGGTQNLSAVSSGSITVNSNYTMDGTLSLICCNSSAAGFTVTVKNSVAYSGRYYTVRKVTSDTNTITLTPTSGFMINGSTSSYTFNTANGAVSFQLDSLGNAWTE